MTTVWHIRDRRPGDVYIGRAGKGEDGYFGNPFPLERESERPAVLHRYKRWFLSRIQKDPEFAARVQALKGKRLVCFCAPKPCHGNVIAEFVNSGMPAWEAWYHMEVERQRDEADDFYREE